MGRPQLYINVSQTIGVVTAATAVFAYIFNFKNFRTDLNYALTHRR